MTSQPYRAARISLYVVGGLVFLVMLAFAFGVLVQYLWNQVAVPVFGLSAITYWQALGLYVLAKLFFGFMPSGPSQQRTRRSRRRPGLSREAEMPADDDETFRRYWEVEGRQAYQAYRAGREERPGDGG